MITDRRTHALNLKLLGHSYASIGRALGVSRQRAQQLISPPGPIRKRVVEIARGLCEKCSVLVGQSGHVHHKGNGSIEDFNDIDNLQLLCVSCHLKAHGGEPAVTKSVAQPPEAQIIDGLETRSCHCGHTWIPRVENPMRCPRCQSLIKS